MLELKVDKLVEKVTDDEHNILSLIHNDPLLSKREVDGLFIANASKELHGPTEIHQQIAKGLVYTINEDGNFEIVALPLLKIWNAHEMEQEQAQVINELVNGGSRILFLEKLDGTMISRFIYNGKVYFATRGVIQGDELAEDYVQKAIDIARDKYPGLLEPNFWPIHTLVMELIHPDCRVITNYGDRMDLVLTAATGPFHRYVAYWKVRHIAQSLDMPFAPVYEAKGDTYKEQMQYLLKQIEGTDAEGFMMVIENPEETEVQYRVKVKGADYIRLLRLMNYCTYKHVVEMILADEKLLQDYNFRKMLMQQSGDDLPQYVIDEYMALHRQYVHFFNAVHHICYSVFRHTNDILFSKDVPLSREDKKQFALLIKDFPAKGLMFRYADGKSLYDVTMEIANKARGDLDYLNQFTGVNNG